MMNISEVCRLANDAYMATLRQHHIGWCPPPGETGDKRWSKLLRAYWPDYTTVDVPTVGPNKPDYREMRNWCDSQPTNYWVNNGANRFYFERRDIAALFKLTFGGAQYHG
jgi:hypothetical protein